MLSMNIMNKMEIKENNADGDNQITAEINYSRIVVDVIQKVFPLSEPETWGQCEEYLAHAIAVGEWAEVSGKQIEVAELFSRVSGFLYERGRWS
jgi:hypothetical protein